MNSPEDTPFGRFLLEWSVMYILLNCIWVGGSILLGMEPLASESSFIINYIIVVMLFFTDLYDDDATSHNIDAAALLGAVILSLVLVLRGEFYATTGLTAMAILFAARIASEDVKAVFDSNMALFKTLLVLLTTLSVYLL